MKILAALLFASFWSVPASALPRLSGEDIAEMHWLTDTAPEARLRTQAAAEWLDDPQASVENWREQIEVRLSALESQGSFSSAPEGTIMDGMLGWLVHARARPLDLMRDNDLLAETLLQGLEMPVTQPVLRAADLWMEVEEKLEAGGETAPRLGVASFWAGLHARAERATPAARQRARAQAFRAADLAGADGLERLSGLAEMARAASETHWVQGDLLRALWRLIDALALQTALLEVSEVGALAGLVASMAEADVNLLRAVDTQLPVVLAQLEDAVAYLAVEPAQRDAAMVDLTDAYFRLAFLVPDASFYLDQPIRDHLSEAVDECLPNPNLVGPLPRNTFERCPERLFALLDDGLDSQELVGGAGPFAPEFLRREATLLSWQRSRYLDGHLDWVLGSSCVPPARANPLEWSILVQALSSWVPQRPVFFQTERWQSAIDEVMAAIQAQDAARRAWLDCLTGQGGQRIDPVSRLLSRHERALATLDLALETAYRDFVQGETRPGSDIDLGASAEQQTTYRPDGLVVRPCAEAMSCGARVALPASRALLGLFPNTYLLADQLGMGNLGLCYDSVRWQDREMRPARPGDDRVANYFGRLSFELVGTFEENGGQETVFRQRLTSNEVHHYLFAAADQEILARDCPDGLTGQPVASRLPADRLGLVPDRLTYFAATPTTANALLSANWEQGAEWRDWFITAERTEVLEAPGPPALKLRVQTALDELAVRRERSIAARLLSDSPPDPLFASLSAVDDSGALIRRVLEIHYPMLVRRNQTVRALLTGTDALIGRAQVRQFRDADRSLTSLADTGRSSLVRLQSFWTTLPDSLREQGQSSPEANHAMRLLSRLRSVSPALVAGGSSPDP